MERMIAVKKLGKLLGKSMGYRVDPKAATREEREAAQAALPAVTAECALLEQEKGARREAILLADEEYQRLVKAHGESRRQREKLFSQIHHHKFTVGTSNGMFFHVKAQGDSWEEVIDKLEH
jgi:hypothetical protein